MARIGIVIKALEIHDEYTTEQSAAPVRQLFARSASSFLPTASGVPVPRASSL